MPDAPLTKEAVVHALHAVLDPELRRDVVSLNMVQHVELHAAAVPGQPPRAVVEIKLPARAASLRERIRTDAEAALTRVGATPDVRFSMQLAGGGSAPEQQPGTPGSAGGAGGASSASGGGGGGGFDASGSNNPLPDVRHILAVGAGKGGVGKSTVAVNLAVGLARAKLRVGLLDGDIYGPSIPTMLGTDRYEVRASGQTLIPFELHGVKAMTLGALVEDDKPLIWRGPMAHGAFKQLATQTDWGTLDYLVVDLPPGTGDVPLTLSQTLPITGAVIVCTPQKVAQDDARRAIAMFRQLRIDVLGLVENMSYFIGDDGKEYDLFGRGGAEMLAQQLGVPFLGRIPINTHLRRNADAGDPTANYTQDDRLAAELTAVVQSLRQQVAAASLTGTGPTLTIS